MMKKFWLNREDLFKWSVMVTFIILNYWCNHKVAVNAEEIKIDNRAKEYKPRPGRKRTQVRQPGGYRGNTCKAQEQAPLTLLVPEDHVPLTTSSHPTFYWYMNTTLSTPIRLTIQEPGQPSLIYVRNWSQGMSGVYAMKLPATVNPLQVGKQYRWTVTVICNPKKPSENIYAKAWIERVKKPNIISNNRSCLESYAESGIWYDALSCPRSNKYSEEFWSLLDQVDLPLIVRERPLITQY